VSGCSSWGAGFGGRDYLIIALLIGGWRVLQNCGLKNFFFVI
jgi:hypothetical protein